MPGEWQKIRLGEVCTKIGSGATPRGGGEVYLESGPFRLIRSQNIYNDGFHHDGLAFIGQKHADELSNVEVRGEDVLLNITGDSVARCCQVDKRVLPARVNQHVAIIRADPQKLDPRFLRYFLVSPEMQVKLLSWAGSGGTRNALTKGMIESLEVSAPKDIKEQRAIAHILGTLDDKIELNRRMNETLEGIARALFKSWFIDFDPVRRNAARKQNQPSPLAPLPAGEGIGARNAAWKQNQPSPRPGGEGDAPGNGGKGHYRGGYAFAGLVETARELRKKQTPAETIFWEMVRDRQFLGLKFRRQHQLGDYVADFYCHEHKLVIEFDGGVHSTKQKKDGKRDAWMKAQGYTVFRFPNEQLLDAPDTVLSALHACLHPDYPKNGTAYSHSTPSPSSLGRRVGDEGVIEGTTFDHLFPDEFVDSELGEIPKGWEVVPLPELITVNPTRYLRRGTAAPYLDMANMPTRGHTPDTVVDRPFGSGTKFMNGDTLVARITPCLENGKTAFVDFLEESQVGWGSTEYIVLRSKSPLPEEFAYCLARSDSFRDFAIQSMTGSSGRQRVPTESLSYYLLTVPSEQLSKRFGTLVSPLFEYASIAAHESRALAALRDELLTKLVSGELRTMLCTQFLKEFYL